MGKVLVTGGAGYIGSHTIVELLSRGYEVVVVDNFINSNPLSLERVQQITSNKIKIYELDLTNEGLVKNIFEENEIDSVIHFAGLKAVGESVEKPLWYYENNLVSTLILCKTMLEHNVNKLVFSSSATVYGDPKSVPISENFPLHATNPYGQTKLMAEQILKDLCSANPDFFVSCLRYFNPVGAHKSGLIGEDPNGIPNNLLPFVTQVAVGKRDSLKIFGNDYDTPDGTGVRDYIHVTDLARGHLAALENIEKYENWEAYNLGTGKGNSVLEIVNAFEEVSGQKIPYEIVDRRPGDIAACYANPEKANSKLDWEAKESLSAACRDAWRWQSNNPNGYKIS